MLGKLKITIAQSSG